MTDIQHVGQGDPQNRLFKQIGTGPDGQAILAEYFSMRRDLRRLLRRQQELTTP